MWEDSFAPCRSSAILVVSLSTKLLYRNWPIQIKWMSHTYSRELYRTVRCRATILDGRGQLQSSKIGWEATEERHNYGKWKENATKHPWSSEVNPLSLFTPKLSVIHPIPKLTLIQAANSQSQTRNSTNQSHAMQPQLASQTRTSNKQYLKLIPTKTTTIDSSWYPNNPWTSSKTQST